RPGAPGSATPGSARRKACAMTSKAAWCRTRMRLRFTVSRADASGGGMRFGFQQKERAYDYATDFHSGSSDDARRRPSLDARHGGNGELGLVDGMARRQFPHP